ncbi:MAG: hypothetical protein IKX19_06915, partial [Clostridia bacterium]|nr:hypothetical protein [Clostridia bacterium]
SRGPELCRNLAGGVFHVCLRCWRLFSRIRGGSAPPPLTVTYITMKPVYIQRIMKDNPIIKAFIFNYL